MLMAVGHQKSTQSYQRTHLSIFFTRLKIAFKWLVRAFSGYLSTDQLLLLWDRIVGYGNLLLLPVLAVAIFLFRQTNLLLITSSSGVEVSYLFSTLT